RGTVHALLEGGDPRLVGADLADDPGLDAGVPHPVSRFPDQLVGQVVDRAPVDKRLGRVMRPAIPAATHDDVQAGPLRQADEALRVAAHAGQRHIYQATAACLAETGELGLDDRLVPGQLPVVPAALDMPQRDRCVLVRQGEADLLGSDTAPNRLDERLPWRSLRHAPSSLFGPGLAAPSRRARRGPTAR